MDAGPADYYAASTQITTSAGVVEYPLLDDFRNLLAVYVRETTDERRPVRPMPNGARGNFKAPSGVWTLDIEYIPVPPVLEDDGDTFDGVSGFEELIANLMARDVMIKRESDPSIVMSNIARMEGRIVARSRGRDKGNPKRTTDLDEVFASPFPWGSAGSSRISCYRLRADNLELFEGLWGFP